MNRRQGKVYVLENENGLVKVGTSINPSSRKSTIESVSGYKINRHFETQCCWNSYEIESLVHKTLGDKRKQGEWFNCTFEEAESAITAIFAISAITEHNAPEPDYKWIEQIIGEFYVKPFVPDYGKTKIEKISQLENFLGYCIRYQPPQ